MIADLEEVMATASRRIGGQLTTITLNQMQLGVNALVQLDGRAPGLTGEEVANGIFLSAAVDRRSTDRFSRDHGGGDKQEELHGDDDDMVALGQCVAQGRVERGWDVHSKESRSSVRTGRGSSDCAKSRVNLTRWVLNVSRTCRQGCNDKSV